MPKRTGSDRMIGDYDRDGFLAEATDPDYRPVVITKGWTVLARSRNLAGIIRYASKHGVSIAEAVNLGDDKGLLLITFGNGAQCAANFASHRVLCDWLGRRRSWRGARAIGGEVF